MTKDDFKEAIQHLKKFQDDMGILNRLIEVLSPDSGATTEIGYSFIDSYIKVLEIALKCPSGWLSDFVFECQYGMYPFRGEHNGKDYSVNTLDEFYQLVTDNTFESVKN